MPHYYHMFYSYLSSLCHHMPSEWTSWIFYSSTVCVSDFSKKISFRKFCNTVQFTRKSYQRLNKISSIMLLFKKRLWVPGPGPSTGGRRLVLEKKIRDVKRFFSRKKGAKTFEMIMGITKEIENSRSKVLGQVTPVCSLAYGTCRCCMALFF